MANPFLWGGTGALLAYIFRRATGPGPAPGQLFAGGMKTSDRNPSDNWRKMFPYTKTPHRPDSIKVNVEVPCGCGARTMSLRRGDDSRSGHCAPQPPACVPKHFRVSDLKPRTFWQPRQGPPPPPPPPNRKPPSITFDRINDLQGPNRSNRYPHYDPFRQDTLDDSIYDSPNRNPLSQNPAPQQPGSFGGGQGVY